MGKLLRVAVVAAVFLAVVLTVTSVVISALAIERLNRGGAGGAQTDMVLRRVGKVLSLLQDAETGQRGYLLTGKPAYLEPFESASNAIQAELEALAELIADNPSQVTRLENVRRGTAVKLTELNDTIEASRTKGPDAALAIVASDRGKAEMDALRLTLSQMTNEEERLRDTRQREAQDAYRRGLQWGIAAALIALIAMLGLAALLRRYLIRRREAEAEIVASGERYRITLFSIGDAVMTTDTHGVVTHLNPAAEALTGWREADAIGKPLTEVFRIVNETTRHTVESPVSKALRDGQVVGLANHTVLLRPDGSEVAIDDSAAPIKGTNGEVEGCVLVFRDVSERQALTRELERSEQQFRTLADSIPQLCWIANPDGHITWYNRGWYDYTGTTFQQMEGWGWQSVHDPEALAGVMERWQASINQRVSFEMVFPLKGSDGRFRQFLTRVLPVKDEEGMVTRWFGTNTDITVVKEAEEVLARRERELQTLADNTPDILTRFDRELRHVFVNAAAERVTGRLAEDFLGKTNRELGMPVELCDMWDAAIGAVFDKGQAVSQEFSYETGSGLRHFGVTLVPEREPSGEVAYVLGVSHDRTTEKEARDALRVADRRKDEFLATLAHELRNPLAPVRTGLQVLKLTQDPDVAERTRLMMERQLGQMVRLIDDLLEVSRITSGKVVLRQERIELQAAIHTAVEAVRPQLDAAGQQLRLVLPPEPIWLHADATRICQVVNNLLTNACKYSPDKSEISLSVVWEGNEAVVVVADHGEGIPQSMLAQVFEMFAQVDRTLDRAQGGLGIGLALVQRLVAMHGGTVSVESAGLGAGSTFTVRLPVESTVEALDSYVAPLGEEAVGTPVRVLVVDDNADAAELLVELISLYGHDAKVADSGLAALELVRDFRPALVLLDIGMPGMNGFETARRIRAEVSSRGIILVALTGWGAEEDRIKANEAGFDHHFTKPVESARIISLLNQVAARQ